MADLLVDLFGFGCFACVKIITDLIVWFNPNKRSAVQCLLNPLTKYLSEFSIVAYYEKTLYVGIQNCIIIRRVRVSE